jgi:hypothetical protein
MPTLKKITLNIGNRQTGRIKSETVIDVKPNYNLIKSKLSSIFKNKYQHKINSSSNPYGKGGATKKIIKIAKNFDQTLLGMMEELMDLGNVATPEELDDFDIEVLKIYCKIKDLDTEGSDKHIRSRVWKNIESEFEMDDQESESESEDESEEESEDEEEIVRPPVEEKKKKKKTVVIDAID